MSLSVNLRSTSMAALIVGILLIAVNLRAPFTALPPLLGEIQISFGLSTMAMGALTTLPLLAFAFISPISVIFSRKVGLERALFFALIAIALGIALRSEGGIWFLYLGTAVIGMGIAIANVLLPSVVKRDFPHHVGLMTSAYALAMGVGSAFASMIVIPLATAWNWQVSLLSFLFLPLMTLVVWSGQLKTPAVQKVVSTKGDVVKSRIWSSALAWQVTLFLGLNSTIYYVIIGWLPAILVDSGYSAAQAGTVHGTLQLATAVPGLLMGAILQRLPDQRLAAAVACLLSAIAMIGFLCFSSLAFIWAIFFGLGTGAGIILGLSLIGLRTSNALQAASLSGMAQCIGYSLASCAPILMGFLHDVFNGWSVPLAISILLALIGAIIGTMAGRNCTIK